MKTERVIRLLEVEKLYALKQRGFQQKPINKEVRQALDIAIEAVKQSENYISKDTYEAGLKSVKAMAEADLKQVIRCKDCKHYIAGFCTRDINGRTNMFRMSENDYCSYGERKAE